MYCTGLNRQTYLEVSHIISCILNEDFCSWKGGTHHHNEHGVQYADYAVQAIPLETNALPIEYTVVVVVEEEYSFNCITNDDKPYHFTQAKCKETVFFKEYFSSLRN